MDKKREAKYHYLRTLYKFDDGKGVKSVILARELGISKPSVSEMLRKLASENLVKIKPYSKVYLTAKGRSQAENHFDSHYTIKRFMKHIIKHPEHKAEKETKKISHLLDKETIRIIENLMKQSTQEQLNKPETILKPTPTYIG